MCVLFLFCNFAECNTQYQLIFVTIFYFVFIFFLQDRFHIAKILCRYYILYCLLIETFNIGLKQLMKPIKNLHIYLMFYIKFLTQKIREMVLLSIGTTIVDKIKNYDSICIFLSCFSINQPFVVVFFFILHSFPSIASKKDIILYSYCIRLITFVSNRYLNLLDLYTKYVHVLITR